MQPCRNSYSYIMRVSKPHMLCVATRRLAGSAVASRFHAHGLAQKRWMSSDFGARDGTPISNKDTILSEVDAALGAKKPPDLEVLLTDHLTCIDSPVSIAMHSVFLRYGHVAARYTTSDGVSRVMNILGSLDSEGATMVNFVKPEDYLYGTHGWDTYAQQGGAYNRDVIGLRVERVAAGATDALHAYYEALHARSLVSSGAGAASSAPGQGAARFQLVEARLSSVANQLPPLPARLLNFALQQVRRATEVLSRGSSPRQKAAPVDEGSGNTLREAALSLCMDAVSDDVRGATFTAGNCAQWTSKGIQFAGLLRRQRLFPKAILIELLEDEFADGRGLSNAHVVVYKHVSHAPPYLPRYRFMKPAYVHPLNPVRNAVYSDMALFADAIVQVPAGATEATVRRVAADHVRRPPRWMPYWRGLVLGVPTAVLLGAVDHIGPIGPATAAAWLTLNWWLY